MLTDEELLIGLTHGVGPLTFPVPEDDTLDNIELAHAIWAWCLIADGPYCVHLFGYVAGLFTGQGYSAGFATMQGENC